MVTDWLLCEWKLFPLGDGSKVPFVPVGCLLVTHGHGRDQAMMSVGGAGRYPLLFQTFCDFLPETGILTNLRRGDLVVTYLMHDQQTSPLQLGREWPVVTRLPICDNKGQRHHEGHGVSVHVVAS